MLPLIPEFRGSYRSTIWSSPNLQSALSAIANRRFDLIVVGIDINDCGALEVVGKITSILPNTPLVCIRAAQPRFRLSDSMVKAINIAAIELGALGFIRFTDFPDHKKGNAAIRKKLENLIERKNILS